MNIDPVLIVRHFYEHFFEHVFSHITIDMLKHFVGWAYPILTSAFLGAVAYFLRHSRLKSIVTTASVACALAFLAPKAMLDPKTADPPVKTADAATPVAGVKSADADTTSIKSAEAEPVKNSDAAVASDNQSGTHDVAVQPIHKGEDASPSQNRIDVPLPQSKPKTRKSSETSTKIHNAQIGGTANGKVDRSGGSIYEAHNGIFGSAYSQSPFNAGFRGANFDVVSANGGLTNGVISANGGLSLQDVASPNNIMRFNVVDAGSSSVSNRIYGTISGSSITLNPGVITGTSAPLYSTRPAGRF
ncbi:hypothetical protein [Tardiphaga sp. 619_E2_N8_5]|uniref:hypothetical protein n=1 Tax=unclassified Tardiphaga TaxID=2631404 RepID=UPI003F24DB3A